MKINNLGTRIANNFIFPIKSGYVLIDTGYENHFFSFSKELRKQKISLGDIVYIFLTHAHDDHAGFLNELMKHSTAKIIMSEKAVEGLRRGHNSFDGGCSSALALLFCKGMLLAGKGAHIFPPVEERFRDRYVLINEQTKPVLERELSAEIIETPGHTVCSISLLLSNGVLFCGDAAMNGFPSLNRATIWIEDVEQFCHSWEKMIRLHPKVICPGHGRPFRVSDLEKYLPKVKKINLLHI